LIIWQWLTFLGHPVDEAMCVVLRCMQFSIIYTYIRTSLSRHIRSTTTSYNRTTKQVQIKKHTTKLYTQSTIKN